MELYNSLIKETRALFEGAAPKTWEPGSRDAWKDLGASELVLQKDAAFELGAQGKGSANYVLFTSNPELVEKDQVLLYGPDLGQIRGETDFARIVLLRVGVLDEDDEVVYRTLKDIEFAKYPESYREQVRVSKAALKKGISFKAIGASYIEAYKKNPNVLNAVVIFVTQPGLDYRRMQDLAKMANKVTGTLTHILEGLPTDCSVCALKDVCDEVEGMKELHFGVGDKGAKH